MAYSIQFPSALEYPLYTQCDEQGHLGQKPKIHCVETKKLPINRGRMPYDTFNTSHGWGNDKRRYWGTHENQV